MPTIQDICTAFNEGRYAELLRLLDLHYGENKPEGYGTLKRTCNHHFNQGLLPPDAAIQRLEALISELEKEKPNTTTDIERNKIKDFYAHLLKYPYHTQKSKLHKYFKTTVGFKSTILMVFGNSKKIDKTPRFELFSNHFLPDSIKKGDDRILPKILGYTKSNRATDDHAIACNLLEQLKGDNEINDDDEDETKQEFFFKVKEHLTNSHLIIPYTIIEKADEEQYKHLSNFIENYWEPLCKELMQETKNETEPPYKNHTLMLLIIVEQDATHKMTTFQLLDEKVALDNFPAYLKVKIDSISYEDCEKWVDMAPGFFINYTCKCFNQSWKNEANNYLPPCGTIEGLFEKITPQVFDEIIYTFPELLKQYTFKS